jgi:hypothetical protein
VKHFEVEQIAFSTIEANYPHSPTDVPASIADYLEDKLSQGYDFVTMSDNGNGPYWVFRVVAK